jgi:hypothetical protein
MTNDPTYVQRLLAEARDEGQWYGGQADAAAKCYEVLALYPGHHEASELIYELFCDPWLIYDNRVALQQQIDEWDDRPWQQRRRAALSFRFMSRWEGWLDEEIRSESGPPDVAALLDQAKGHLIPAYCLGDEASGDAAWPLFAEAMASARDPQATMLWVGACYADMGFFADAAEVLTALCARAGSPPGSAQAAARLLAEVRWWRDNMHRLPWLPPPGDGTRYWRMMAFVDPEAASDEDVLAELRARAAAQGTPAPAPLLDPGVARRIEDALPAMSAPPAPGLVDWSFLDTDDGQPGEPPPWAQRMLHLFPGAMAEDMARRYRWTRTIPPPDTPRRYNPDEPPPGDAQFDEDDWLDDGDDWHGADDDLF